MLRGREHSLEWGKEAWLVLTLSKRPCYEEVWHKKCDNKFETLEWWKKVWPEQNNKKYLALEWGNGVRFEH